MRLTRDGSNFSCLTSQKSSNNFSHRSRKSQGSSSQHLDAILSGDFENDRRGTYHRSWIFSTSRVSKFLRMMSRKELRSSITSWNVDNPISVIILFFRRTSTDLDHFHGLLLHALGPRQLRSFLRLAWPQQNLEAFLDIVHEVFGSVRVIQQVFANNKLERLSGRCSRL